MLVYWNHHHASLLRLSTIQVSVSGLGVLLKSSKKQIFCCWAWGPSHHLSNFSDIVPIRLLDLAFIRQKKRVHITRPVFTTHLYIVLTLRRSKVLSCFSSPVVFVKIFGTTENFLTCQGNPYKQIQIEKIVTAPPSELPFRTRFILSPQT